MRRATFLKAEADFTLDGVTYRLVLDNLAWLAIEDILDTSLLDFMSRLKSTIEAGRNPRIGDMAAVLAASLDRHHGMIPLEDAAEMLMSGDDELKSALVTVINGSLPGQGEADTGSGNASSPAPTVGIGRVSSGNGPAPGSRSTPSGKARRVSSRQRSGAKPRS